MLYVSSAILSELVNQNQPENMNPLFSSLNHFATHLLDYLEFKREESRFESDESNALIFDDGYKSINDASAGIATAYHNGRFDAFNEMLEMLSELRQLDQLNAP